MYILNYLEGKDNPFVGIFNTEEEAFASAVKLVSAICKDDDITFKSPEPVSEADFRKSGRQYYFDGEKKYYYSSATRTFIVIQEVAVGKNYRLLWKRGKLIYERKKQRKKFLKNLEFQLM